MEKLISTERIPIKLWLDDIEEGAFEQAKNLANLPFAFCLPSAITVILTELPAPTKTSKK